MFRYFVRKIPDSSTHNIPKFSSFPQKAVVLKYGLKKISDENLNLHWYAGNGLIATSLDDEMLRVMEASGCIGFKIGIESGNKEV